MRLLRVHSRWIAVLLLIVTFFSLLPATWFKNINRETGSEPTTGRVPSAFQLDREVIVLERFELPSAAAPIFSVTLTDISQNNGANFAATLECHHSGLGQRQHTLRI